MQNKESNSKKKEVYKINNKNNTRVYITIAILILLLFQFIALGLSRAQKLVEISVTMLDAENIVSLQNTIVNAIDSGDSGSFIFLPDKVNNIYVTEYHILNSEIIESKEENDDEDVNYDIRVPGDKVFLTEEELKDRNIEITAIYNSKEVDDSSLDEKLYYQDFYVKDYIESEESLSNIVLKGFLPLNLQLELNTEIPLAVDSIINDTLEENHSIEKILNIVFKLDDDEYDISKINEDFIISIFPVNMEKVYSVYNVNKKPEYIGKENVKDALGKDINTFNIEEAESYSINKDILRINVNISDIEYLGITSKPNGFMKMQGLGGFDISPMGMEIPDSFDPNTNTDIWDGSMSTSFLGAGQANNPYLITSGADLAYLRDRVNANITYENQYFQLTNNIDLDDRTWEPIGNYTRPFRGNLDGAGRTIKNGLVVASGTIPTNTAGNVLSFGFFGSIGGGTNAANRQTIKNLELDNIVVESRFTGNTATGTNDRIHGINLGTLAGTMYQNCTISNVNVRNLDVHHSGYTMRVRAYRFQYAIGGLVGEAIRLPNTIGDPGANLRYSIVNSVVDGDFNITSVTTNNTASATQFSTGGIIARIRSQPVWPENCIYRGNINSPSSFIGPIFGQLRHNTIATGTNNFPALWNGNDAGNLTCTSSYNSFTAAGTTFTVTEISGNSNSRRSSTTTNIGYAQGVNKGIYQNNNTTLLTALNNSTESSTVKWTFSTQNGFQLRPRLIAGVIENPENTFITQVDDSYYSATPYTYQWVIDNVVSSNTSSVYVQTEPNFDVDIDVVVRVRDNAGYISIYKFIIPRLYVEMTFNINSTQNTAEGILSGTGWYLTGYSDYSFQWYREDISGYEDIAIPGATSRFITGLDTAYDYKLIATNNVIPDLSCENGFEYAVRTVIYLRSNGNNNNNGLTPTTPVQNMQTAYSKLPTNGTRNTNVIVVMGSITDNQLFTGETSANYKKNVTLTGVYKKEDYNGLIRLNGSTTYKYMNGDTTFMYLTINGNNDQLYWYLQGFSLTIGEQVQMTGYTVANTNQGLIAGNAPGFHIFGSWHKFNQASLPRNNPEILIRSGTFGRIILGGSPGTNAVANLQNNTSRNFTGSAADPFNTKVTIDIKNSTTPATYAFDINLLVGGSAAGNNYSNVVQNIVSGKVGRVLGGAIGDSSVRPSGWSYPINTFMGTVEINISGGEVTELYGGSLGRNMSAMTGSSSIMCDSYFYGTVEINITGGIITGDIYGAGAGRSVWLSYKLIRSI